jgi:hypothetical protein
MIYDRNSVFLKQDGINGVEVALYSYLPLSAMEMVIKVLHCDADIIESETIMTFLSDEKVSDNEQIVYSLSIYLI